MFKTLSILAVSMVLGASALAESNSDDEAYGLGALMLLTADGAQFGGLYVRPNYEIELTFDGSAQNPKQSNVSADEDMGITARVGYRISLGHSNSLSLGVHYHQNLFGKSEDSDGKAQEYRFGEYVGFKRYWSGSNVYLMAFVMPVSYQQNRTKDPDGVVVSDKSYYHFFQEGGFGIGYIF